MRAHEDEVFRACDRLASARLAVALAEQELRSLLSPRGETATPDEPAPAKLRKKRAPNIRPSDPAKPDAPATIRDRVLDVMRTHGDVIAGQEIATRAGVGLGSVLAVLSKMSSSGVVERVAAGQYRLVQTNG